MQRSKFNLSQYKLFTCNMGELVPCSLTEVLPGDSFLGNTSCLVRTTPLAAPVMHPVQVRLHHFFVPTRLLWEDWEKFITGGKDGLGEGAIYPATVTGAGGFAEKSVADYLGLPPGIQGIEFSQLPIRAFNKIYNEYYRDQDLVDEREEDFAGLVPRIAWEKDYFTASRPFSQRGPEVTLPLGDRAPIVGYGMEFDGQENGDNYLQVRDENGDLKSIAVGPTYAYGATVSNGQGEIGVDLSQATAASVNDIREAFALQRYQEARARYGARYTEYLRYCGVVPSDARLDRPEYLGGGKSTISFSEVLQTQRTDEDQAPLGTLGGHGIAVMGTRKYMRYFTEHGFVMSLFSARPKSIYEQGIPRHWNRRTKEDYWQKELEHIGQQEILNKEIYAQGDASDDGVFGYQDRYSEYRKSPSTVAGQMRSGKVYDDWHLARQFTALPALNQDFTDCDPGDRIFAVGGTTDQLQVMCQNTIKARRPVSRTAQNRIY